jgi:hypothetical protein
MLRIDIMPFELEEIEIKFKKRTIITKMKLRSSFDMIEDYLQFSAMRHLDLIYSKYIIDNKEIQPLLVLDQYQIRENYIRNGTRNGFSGYMTIKRLGITEERLLKFVLNGFDHHIFIFKNYTKGFIGAVV